MIAAILSVVMAWSASTGTIVVAHDGVIEGFDRAGETRLWTAKGLASPSAIVTSADGKSAAVLDGFKDRVAIVNVAGGAVAQHETRATPVAAAFFERDVWVVLRDRNRVVRITPEGKTTEVDVALDPALIAAGEKFVYVYSRAAGLLQEIDPKAAQVARSTSVGTAGSDLEIRLGTAYLCRPANGKIVTIDLVKMESRETNAGGAPVDLAFVPFGAQLPVDPGTPFVADPGRISADRITITAAGVFAFDSNRGIVYRIEGRKVTKVAAATSFVATDEALFTWDPKSGKPRRETIVR